MNGLTKKEAIATVGAIDTTINMLSDLIMQNKDIKEAIDTLVSARNKIEIIYKVNEQ